MVIWRGIAGSAEKKLAEHIRAWQGREYAFTRKVFSNAEHGGKARVTAAVTMGKGSPALSAGDILPGSDRRVSVQKRSLE